MSSTALQHQIEIRSPWSSRIVGTAPSMTGDDAARAIDAAAAAMSEPLSTHRRAAILSNAAAALREREEEFVTLLIGEAGKPRRLAEMEVQRAVLTFETAAAVARTLTGEMVPMDAPGNGHRLAFTMRLPAGVVGAITPFSAPLNLTAHKVAPAIAAGCAVVLKPSERTPLCALLLREVLRDAGLPSGWLHVVTAAADSVVDAFIHDARLRVISFTGSAATGWRLQERAARKRVLLELGNVTPAIVHADADLDIAVPRLCNGAFLNAGQGCVSVQRIFVHDSIADDFIDRFLGCTAQLRSGDPHDPATDVGPMISVAAADRVRTWVGEAVAAGATLLTDAPATEGNVIAPVVLADVATDSRLARHEIFGPVVGINRFSSIADAVAEANATGYGLQAAIFTRDIGAALHAVGDLQFGGVMVNETPSFRSDPMPYGGVKDSGNTKEGPARAVLAMTDERLVVIDPGVTGYRYQAISRPRLTPATPRASTA